MIRFYLNDYNNECKIKDGVVYRENADETLDSAVVVIPFSEKLEINPYDSCWLEIDNNPIISMIVDTFTEQRINNEDEIYEYTLSLISPTAKLDKIRIPNRVFTPRFNRSVLWQCKEIIKYYQKRTGKSVYFTQRFRDRFSQIEGVEKQLNKPTIREALNELLRIDNCIVKMINNTAIDFIDLSERKEEIDSSKFYLNEAQQNASDYASALIVDAENCQSEDIAVYNEFLTIKTENSPVVSTQNMQLITQHPIDEIVEVKIRLINNGEDLIIVDGGDKLIIEKANYDLLKVNTLNAEESKLHHFYYSRHSNIIDGLSYNEQIFGFLQSGTALEIAIGAMLINGGKQVDSNLDWLGIVFEITYKSTEKISFTKDKDEYVNYAELTDSQIDNYINLDLFGIVEKEKVNRIGNEEKTITAMYNGFENCPKLLQTFGDYVLTRREISIFNDYVLFKGTFTEKYVFESTFYGVNAKRRSYNIESGDKAITRSEIVKRALTFTLVQPPSNERDSRFFLMRLASNNIPSIVDSDGFGGSETYNIIRNKRIQLTACYTTFENYETSLEFALTPYFAKCGDSLLVNYKFYDNFSVGMYQNQNKGTGGNALEYLRYVDENGEISKLTIVSYDSFNQNVSRRHLYQYSQWLPYVNPDYKQFVLSSIDKVDTTNIDLHKDSNEILDITIQYDLFGDDNVIVNPSALSDLMFEVNLTSSRYFTIWYSETKKYKKGDKKVVDDSIQITDGSFEIDYSDLKNFILNGVSFYRLKMYNENIDTSKWQSYALSYNDGTILLAVNRTNLGVLSETIYLSNKEI